MVACFFEPHEIAAELYMKTLPEVECFTPRAVSNWRRRDQGPHRRQPALRRRESGQHEWLPRSSGARTCVNTGVLRACGWATPSLPLTTLTA